MNVNLVRFSLLEGIKVDIPKGWAVISDREDCSFLLAWYRRSKDLGSESKKLKW